MTNELDTLTAWRREHAEALAALQEAQRAYHREAVGPPSLDGLRRGRQVSLEMLDAARARLDEVRARMPRQ